MQLFGTKVNIDYGTDTPRIITALRVLPIYQEVRGQFYEILDKPALLNRVCKDPEKFKLHQMTGTGRRCYLLREVA